MLHRLGYDLRRIPPDWTGLGQDPFRDMRELTVAPQQPVLFDVGANVGQTIELFRQRFERPIIHAFEPSPEAFAQLQHWSAGMPDLHLNNFALGSCSETRPFIENTETVMGSFLEPGSITWGEVTCTRLVDVSTVDDYCADRGIARINVLKTDTQGFDLEVLKGAAGMIRQRAIELVLIEITFSDVYVGQPGLDEIWGFMTGHGFALVTFYPFQYLRQKAHWTDALFVHPNFVYS